VFNLNGNTNSGRAYAGENNMKNEKAIKEQVKALILESEPNRAQYIETDLRYNFKRLKKSGYFVNGYPAYGITIKKGKAVYMTAGQIEAVESREAITYLKKRISEGDTVQTILRHVSRSGMSRDISCIHKGEDITYYVAKAKQDTRAKNGGIKCGGCGMDMGFNLVYNLGHVLFPNGSEKGLVIGRNGDKKPETDGGYLLKQSWL
jgi:hypothetical protein